MLDDHRDIFSEENLIPAHNNSLLVQPLFSTLAADTIKPEVFEHGPCWAVLKPGMSMEKH